MPLRIAILGGGLSGLSVALGCLDAGHHVTLFERAPRLGGQIWTEYLDVEGVRLVVERGAEGFVASSAAAQQLATRLGIAADLVDQSSNLSFAYEGAELRELKPGEAAQLLGFQVPKGELGRGIRSLRHGSGQLTARLADEVRARADVHLGAEVTELSREVTGWRLLPQDLAVDRVVVALPAPAAAPLLAAHVGDVAAQLAAAPTLSNLNVTLVYRREQLPALRGTGFIALGAGQIDGFRACSYASLKLPDKAPAEWVLLRAFFRPEEHDLRDLTDADWSRRAEAILQRALGYTASSAHWIVGRWPNALPVHTPEFRAAVEVTEQRLAGLGVHLVGSAFHGSGIDAALRSVNDLVATLSQ